jgi:adhesin transport system outer membrane protein
MWVEACGNASDGARRGDVGEVAYFVAYFRESSSDRGPGNSRPLGHGGWRIARLALVVAGMLGPAHAATAQSFKEELRFLLDTNPRIQADTSNVAAADFGVDQAFATFLPSVDLSGSAGYSVVDSPGRRASSGDAFRGDRKKITLTITQSLFDGFSNEAGLAGARSSFQLAEDTLDQTSQNILFRGITAYLGVLRHSQLLELAELNEKNIQRQLDLEDERVRRGSGLTVDVLQAKSRLQLSKERRVTFSGGFRDSITRYLGLFGHAPVAETMIEPELDSDLLPESLEYAIAKARVDNPSLSQRDRQIDIARSQREVARSACFPQVDLVASGNWEEDIEGVEGKKRDATILVQLTWNLFGGGGTRASVRRANEEVSAAMSNLNLADREVIQEVRLAWESLETARERVGLLENAVNIAGEVLDAREKLRAAGKESALNVLDSENELNAARITFLSASFDAKEAGYRLLLSMGVLTPGRLGLP